MAEPAILSAAAGHPPPSRGTVNRYFRSPERLPLVGVNMSLWTISFTLPKDEGKGRRWTLNERHSVLAITLEDALARVRERHPDAVFYNVNHAGVVTIP